MPLDATKPPQTDPTPLFELYRGKYASELLTAAVAHFKLFDRLAAGPRDFESLRAELGFAERPFVVLIAALRAMALLSADAHGRLQLTPAAREHLVSTDYFSITDYISMTADTPGVLEMVTRLTTNKAAGQEPDEQGAAFIYRDGIESAMERESTARHFTLMLAGRAKNVAPLLAERLSLSTAGESRPLAPGESPGVTATRLLLDVGGGTGIYSIACLQRYPQLKSIVWDRPEVLKVAGEMAAAYGVADRLQLVPGDMFVDPVPAGADVILLSNILHDWDVPQCKTLINRCAAALGPGGRLVIHDVFLNDALDGPLPVALYSAALFQVTEGRAYSAGEFRAWLAEAGLQSGAMVPTLVHCGILAASKNH